MICLNQNTVRAGPRQETRTWALSLGLYCPSRCRQRKTAPSLPLSRSLSTILALAVLASVPQKWHKEDQQPHFPLPAMPSENFDKANRWSHGTGSISTPSFQGCSQSCNSYAHCTNHNYVLQMHVVFVWGCYPKRGKVSETFPLARYPNSPQGSEGRVKCRKELAEAPSLSAFSFKLCRIKDRCLCCPCDGTIWTHFCPSGCCGLTFVLNSTNFCVFPARTLQDKRTRT